MLPPMPKSKRAIILYVVGLLVCVVPPLLATLEYFPLFNERQRLSVLSLLIALLCTIPLWRSLRTFFKNPSAWKIWLAMLLLMTALRSIADEVIVIAWIGLPSGIIGSALFWFSRHADEKANGRSEWQ